MSTGVTTTEKTVRPKTNRRVPRIPADFPVILNFEKKRFYCRAHQLSEFGILVIPTEKKLIGEIVKIDLLPEPPNHSLSLFGIVAYAIDSGIGIRFTDLQPEQQSELKRYVEFLREQHQADRKMCRI